MSSLTTAPAAPSTRFAALRGYGRYAPPAVTFVLLVALFIYGGSQYDQFASAQTLYDILRANAHLMLLAIGMTFVIVSGGIDLSVGSMLAFGGMLYVTLIQNGWAWPLAVIVTLLVGTLLGAAMGAMIHYFEIQPFIVTLGGLFLARGLTFMLSLSRKSIPDHPFTLSMSKSQVKLPGGYVPNMVIMALVVAAIAAYVLASTRFGRSVYALGGNEASASLMGLNVARSKVAVYAISGFCSVLGGLAFTWATLTGDTAYGVGTELDAIAAVVIGGALLTGGTGYVVGTVLGVLTLGMITALINANGTLSSWWARIAIGALLLLFIVVQRAVSTVRRRPA